MDTLDISEYLLKQIRGRRSQITEKLSYGGVSDWDQYKQLVGEVSGLTFAENEILDLLKRWEKAQ